MRISLIILIVLSFFAGCQSNETSDASFVNQSQIHQQYVLEYDENSNELYASACFRFGGPNGTTLVIDSTGDIKFDQQKLQRGKFIMGGAFYKIRKIDSSTAVVGSHLFSWTNSEKEIIENPADLHHIQVINMPSILNLSSDIEMEISAQMLRDSENIVVEIMDTSTSVKLTYTQSEIRNNRIVLDSKALKNINGNKGSLNIRRTVDLPLKNGEKPGGLIRVVYITKTKEVKFSK